MPIPPVGSNVLHFQVAVKVVRHFVPGEHDPVKVIERMNAVSRMMLHA